jgi:hypothetical protein
LYPAVDVNENVFFERAFMYPHARTPYARKLRLFRHGSQELAFGHRKVPFFVKGRDIEDSLLATFLHGDRR